MKKMFLGLSSALFIVGSVMGMHKERSKSVPPIGVKRFEIIRSRADSAPVTGREIQTAINKWSHLVPQNVTTTQVNNALREVVTSDMRKEKMAPLVELICNPANDRAYANYAHMVFVSAIPDCSDEERNKFGGMLAAIASSRGGTSSLFWDWYANGYFDSIPLEVE
jgi:hypothetical protein